MISNRTRVDKQACSLSAMLHHGDPGAPAQTSSLSLPICSRVLPCCCQALIARAELYYTADVVGNGEGVGGGVTSCSPGIV